MDDALDERNARTFDVPDNSDEAPRLSERAAAREATSELAVKKLIAAEPAASRARRRLSIVRLSQCILLANLSMVRRCSRRLGVATGRRLRLSLQRGCHAL
jgi:hypothetical protein